MTSILKESNFELVGHLEERGEVPTIANTNNPNMKLYTPYGVPSGWFNNEPYGENDD